MLITLNFMMMVKRLMFSIDDKRCSISPLPYSYPYPILSYLILSLLYPTIPLARQTRPLNRDAPQHIFAVHKSTCSPAFLPSLTTNTTPDMSPQNCWFVNIRGFTINNLNLRQITGKKQSILASIELIDAIGL